MFILLSKNEGDIIKSNACDIFEDLRSIVRCDDISDLRFEPFNTQAKLMFFELDLNKYSKKDILEIIKYLK